MIHLRPPSRLVVERKSDLPAVNRARCLLCQFGYEIARYGECVEFFEKGALNELGIPMYAWFCMRHKEFSAFCSALYKLQLAEKRAQQAEEQVGELKQVVEDFGSRLTGW